MTFDVHIKVFVLVVTAVGSLDHVYVGNAAAARPLHVEMDEEMLISLRVLLDR